MRGECASWWGTGPENQRDLRVRGSIPPLSSTFCPETMCLSVRHTGPLRRRAHSALREFDSLRLLRVGPVPDDGGEPSAGTARSLVEVAKTVRPPAATRCTRGFDSRPRLQFFALKVFAAARWLARSEERVRFPLSAHDARVADRFEAPAFQAGEAGSIPAACSAWFCREGWTRAGLISRTLSVRFRPLQRGRPRGAALVNRASQGANVSKSTG